MFENLFEHMKERFKESAERKAQDREQIRRINIEVDAERRRAFEEEFKKNSLKLAIGSAKKDAAKKSGMQKLRAQNRLRNLQKNDQAPGSFFSKLSDFTQKNLARREENMKKTDAIREDSKKLREENMNKRLSQRQPAPMFRR